MKPIALALLLLGVLACAPGVPPRGVVVVVVDALRADHLGVYGYDRPTPESRSRRSLDPDLGSAA